MNFRDRFEIDAKAIMRKTREGYLVAMPRVARAGNIQLYRGDEVDPDNKHGFKDKAQVRVFRPEAEVFDKESLRSYAHRPFTDDHPDTPLTAETWADHAIGNIGDEAARDGEFVRVPLVAMDAAAIKKIDAGKAELSVGYSCDLAFEAGEAPGGLKFDAFQKNIRVNHVALVGLARGGPELRIGDEKVMALRKVLLDGIHYEAEDQIASVIEKVAKDRDTAVASIAAKDAQIGTLTAQVSAKDGEIAVLKSDAEKNKITPAMIDERVKAKLEVAGNAKKIMGDAFATDGKDADAIKKEVVDAKLGDAAKTFVLADGKPNMDSINAAFATLLAGVGHQQTDTFRETTRIGGVVAQGDGASLAERALADSDRERQEAWQRKEDRKSA